MSATGSRGKPVQPSFRVAKRQKPAVSLREARTLVVRVLEQAESGWLYGKNLEEMLAQLIEAADKLLPEKKLTREIANEAVLKLRENRIIALHLGEGTCTMKLA